MEQNLLSFVSEMREDLKEFQEEWLSNNELNPEDFPLDLPEEEWFEQYLCWINSK